MTSGPSPTPTVPPVPVYRPRFEPAFFRPRFWPTWLLLGLMRLGTWLPLGLIQRLGAGLGMIYFAANAKRRRIARINIRLCFPQLPAAEREQLVRDHYRAAGRSLFDLGFAWWASPRRLDRHVTVHGLDEFLELLRQGRRVIVLTGHFLNADFGGIFISRFHPGLVMMKEIKNPVFNWYIWKGRTRFLGVTTLRQQGLRPLIRAVRAGYFTYYVPDEDFGAKQSVFVPFFGVPTATLPVLGRLAETTDAVVVPCFTHTLPGGKGYEITLAEPLTGFPSGDPATDARRMNEALEMGIRAMPEQYMWTFKWFRTRPDNAPSPYDESANQ